MSSDHERQTAAKTSGPDENQQEHMEDKQDGNRVQLRRSLGVASGASMIVGVIIGSGIFVSPRGVLQDAGSPAASLLVWSICGLFTMMGALCFAELGTSVLASGGEYTYIKLAYGSQLSFLYLWVQVAVIVPCSAAISALTFADYLLQPLYPQCEPPHLPKSLVGLALVLLLVHINCATVRGSLRLQNSFTIGKVLALALIIAFGLYHLLASTGSKQLSSLDEMWSLSETNPGRLAQAFYVAYYTYAGWNSLNFVTEEMRDPVRNMPRAIILSITTITLIYILTNGAYFAVLTREEMLQSSAIAVTFGERVMPWAKWLMPLLVALSTMGGLNGHFFATSRMIYVGARQGQLPSALKFIHVDHLTPVPSLIWLGLTSSMYLFAGDVLTLIKYTVFVEAFLAAAGVSTVLALRHKLPNLPRPLQVNIIIPIAYLLFSFLLVALPIWQEPLEAVLGLGIMFLGLPVYWLTVRWKDKPPRYRHYLRQFNLITQRLTMSLPPEASVELAPS